MAAKNEQSKTSKKRKQNSGKQGEVENSTRKKLKAVGGPKVANPPSKGFKKPFKSSKLPAKSHSTKSDNVPKTKRESRIQAKVDFALQLSLPCVLFFASRLCIDDYVAI